MANYAANLLPALVRSYLEDYLVRDRGLSPKTRQSYADSLILLFRYLAVHLSKNIDMLRFDDLSAALVRSFLTNLENVRGNSVRSRNLRLSAIKSFLGYCAMMDPTLMDLASSVRLISGKKCAMPKIDYLDHIEIKALLEAPDPNTISGIRDRTMILIAFAYGLRVSELLNLSLASVWLGQSPTIDILGKGGKRDTMPILEEHKEVLLSWLNVRPHSQSTAFFLNRSGGPFSRDGFAYILSKHAKTAATKLSSIGTKHVTPHVLRHSCAMAVLRSTKDPRKAARMLRHVGYSTIEVYLHADAAEKISILSGHPELGIKPGNFSSRAPGLLALLRSAKSMQ